MNNVRVGFVSLLVALLPSMAFAADPLIVGAGEKIDPATVARILNPEIMKTRSINQEPVAGSIAVRIPFAFNSAKVDESANSQLEAIADGIKLAGVKVVIEGHTDAVGSVDYNKRLSLKRAAAVRDSLIAQYGVAPDSVRAAGLGKSRPLPKVEPTSSENRRVELRSDR